MRVLHQTYIVYADTLFITNFLLDYGILWATARFGHFPASGMRIALGALIGALYGSFMIYPQASIFYSISLKMLVSLFIVAVTFTKLTLKKYLQAVVYFYLISFAMAGAVLGGSSILASKSSAFFQGLNVNSTGLIFAVAVAFILGRWGITYLKRNWQKSQFRVSVEIFLDNSSLIVEALIDTGNELRDPLSQKPVMVIEYQAIKKILPEDFQQNFEKYGSTDVTKIIENLDESSLMKRIRVVPFSSIGKHHGMLIGFKPDVVTLFGPEKKSTKDVIICIYHKSLSSQGGYRAVLNPEVLEATA